MLRSFTHVLVALAAIPTLACGGDDGSLAPTTADVAGSYTATSFTATQGGTTTDLLAAGGSITATLAANGSTTGRLIVPAAATGGAGAIDEDLTGTWRLSGTTVTFNQTADTFLRDVPFTVEPNRLRGQGVFADATVHVTLSK